MNSEGLIKIVEMVCYDYIDTILTGIEDSEEEFPYTIACAKFIDKLKEKHIRHNFSDIFSDIVRDKIYGEIKNYLAK